METRLSDVRRITTHMGLLSYCTEFTILSIRHRNEARQWSLAAYSGFAMQLINHLIDVSFLPQRTGISV